jgi:predicted acylesterase/phospholipase RssA
VDGGVLNNIPVSIPREEGIRRVLAVDVGSFREVPLESLNNCPQVLMRTMETSLNALKERDPRQPTLRLYASGGGDAFSFHRLKILLELGEKAVEAARRELDAFFGSGLRRFFLPKTCGLREAPCNGRA